MLRNRVSTAVLGIPLLLVLSYFGGIWATLMIIVLVAIATDEYCHMLENKDINIPKTVVISVSVILSLGFYYLHFYVWLVLFFFFIATVFWAMLKSVSWEKFSMLFLGVLYIGIGFGLLLSLRLDFDNYYYILFAFIISWATDSGAYFIGCSMGKRKLAPTISPNKTVEGMVGGVFFALLIAGTYVYFFDLVPMPYAIIIILLASLVGQIGDLFESYLKRYFGVKDSGGILPGHGGILDRFDSILTIAPLLYLLLHWIL